MAQLHAKSWLDHHSMSLEKWEREAYLSFASMIADDDNSYPCVPGRQGFLTDNLRFGFAPDPRTEAAAREVADLLAQYGPLSRETGKYASLVIFFSTPEDLLESASVENYEELFWSLLSDASKLDAAPWPESIPRDPGHHEWEFCYGGEPYFAFCATPAHVVRRSRSFSGFLVAFQPRWVFREINDSTPFGRNMKKIIRRKLADYDGIPAHPSLKWYGQQDNQEWQQYYLRDDDSALSKCPFLSGKIKLPDGD
ncbi:YqcI/YcgG family protein [Paenibacillus sp. D51F]